MPNDCDCQIICGDALECLRSLADESVDMCLTSPPYFGLRDYGVAGQLGQESTSEEYIDRLLLIFAEVHRVLKQSGTFWLNIGDGYVGSGQGAGTKHPSDKQFSNRGTQYMFGNGYQSKLRNLAGCKSKDMLGMIKVSEELLNDSVFDVAGYIAREFARRIGAAEEEAFFTGNGTGKPTGILNATGGAETGVTAASATAVTFDEVIDLFYSLRAPYRRNSVFIMNDATVKALRKLKNGNGDYLWTPSVTAGTPDTVLNRPVYTSTFMPTLAASAKSILFGDLGYYWIADREGRSFKRLNELYAPTGQVGFLASERVDGRLILPEAVKVLAMKA